MHVIYLCHIEMWQLPCLIQLIASLRAICFGFINVGYKLEKMKVIKCCLCYECFFLFLLSFLFFVCLFLRNICRGILYLIFFCAIRINWPFLKTLITVKIKFIDHYLKIVIYKLYLYSDPVSIYTKILFFWCIHDIKYFEFIPDDVIRVFVSLNLFMQVHIYHSFQDIHDVCHILCVQCYNKNALKFILLHRTRLLENVLLLLTKTFRLRVLMWKYMRYRKDTDEYKRTTLFLNC